MESSFVNGNAYIYLSEQTNKDALIKDNIIDQSEMLSMTLMYEGSETTLRQVLADNPLVKVENLNVIAEVKDSADLKIGAMSTLSLGANKTTLTAGITREQFCAQLLDSMIWDELQEQLKEIVNQGMDEFSYERLNK